MADPTPKPIELVQGHRTKAEIRQRSKEEKALMTGMAFKEWPEVRENKIAHKQFTRLRRLYRSIDKDDAIFETVLNRYCIMLAECADYESEYQRLHAIAEKLEDTESELEFKDYINAVIEVNKQLQANDKLLQNKRKMLLDIEKENVMTLVSAMRSIPKKPVSKEKLSGIAAYRQKRMEG